MFGKFERLTEEKQKRIINAAIKEFATKGYKLASTDTIAKEADISKGALFNYFVNKKEMFKYIFEYALNITLVDFFDKVDLNEKDVIKRYKKAILVKLSLMQIYPDIFDFMTNVTIEDNIEIKPFIDEKIKEISKDSYSKIFVDIDVSVFKEGIDAQKAISIIMWTLEGYSHQLLETYKRMNISLKELELEKIFKELDEYLSILKQCLYK